MDSYRLSRFFLPHPVDNLAEELIEPQSFDLENVLKSQANLKSYRHNAYIQYQQSISRTTLNAGVRGSYWDLNEEYLVSPRASLSYRPSWRNDILFEYLLEFIINLLYREMRNLVGELNKRLKAQKSTHFILGSDYNFSIWKRPFKLVTELYYKQLNNLIPYEIDNVRSRYYAENSAEGYAGGVDIRLNGEFVKGMESWASLSVMKTVPT